MLNRTNYRHFGVMLDCSRNAVMKVEQIKKIIDILSLMGYNCLELYTEDTYEIKGEPYFGYMRGRYTSAEIKEIDAYAKEKGLELIPCIQTLAHLEGMFRHKEYAAINDTANILMVDEERTYQLIDKMFATLAENFTSRLVNIGMDEAHMVGLGKFLDKYGYQNRFELLSRHLKKVLDIATKYGFKAHMWSDMYFRLANHDRYYVNEDFVMPAKVIEQIPEGVALVYWDYYHKLKKDFDDNMLAHKALGKPFWFAGGAWTWNGFAPLNEFSLITMKGAIESVRSTGVQDVLITMWRDNGSECSFYAVLPALYAIRQYAEGNFDEEKIAQGFEKLFGIRYDDFLALDLPNGDGEMFKECGFPIQQNPCKILLYSDPFMGIKDDQYAKRPAWDFADYAKRIASAGAKAGEYGYIFDVLSKLCETLAYKARLGVNTRAAYEAKDKKALQALLSDYEEAYKKLLVFHEAFYELWKKENKPYGWEIQDARLGGVAMRLKTCRKRLEEYLNGEVDKIDELEEKLLPTEENLYMLKNNYSQLISWNHLG